jgi:small subunit ribosomal protein S6
MPANVYECMFLLDTNKVAGDIKEAANQLHTVLEQNEAEVLASRPWDERKLAYPIQGHKKGLYYLTYFRTEGKNVSGIERDFAHNELILRMLTTKINPKLVDVMLRVARDEHAVALPTVNEASEGGGDADVRRSPRPAEKQGEAPPSGEGAQ